MGNSKEKPSSQAKRLPEGCSHALVSMCMAPDSPSSILVLLLKRISNLLTPQHKFNNNLSNLITRNMLKCLFGQFQM